MLTRSDDFSISEVGELVAKISVLVGKLLGIANSSYYGGGKINDLSQAINQVPGMN